MTKYLILFLLAFPAWADKYQDHMDSPLVEQCLTEVMMSRDGMVMRIRNVDVVETSNDWTFDSDRDRAYYVSIAQKGWDWMDTYMKKNDVFEYHAYRIANEMKQACKGVQI